MGWLLRAQRWSGGQRSSLRQVDPLWVGVTLRENTSQSLSEVFYPGAGGDLSHGTRELALSVGDCQLGRCVVYRWHSHVSSASPTAMSLFCHCHSQCSVGGARFSNPALLWRKK